MLRKYRNLQFRYNIIFEHKNNFDDEDKTIFKIYLFLFQTLNKLGSCENRESNNSEKKSRKPKSA